MIYLLRKHDIISVPSYAAGIYHPPKVDIISKIYHPFRQERISSKKVPFVYQTKGTFLLEQDTGVEPAFTAWEAVVLPIYESCVYSGIIADRNGKFNHYLSRRFLVLGENLWYDNQKDRRFFHEGI